MYNLIIFFSAANCVTIRNDTVATEVLEVALGDHASGKQMKIYKVKILKNVPKY